MAATLVLVAMSVPRDGVSSALTVPDDVPSIQEALDAGVDSVLVRAGNYAETAVVSRPGILLMGASGDPADLPTIAGLRIYIYSSDVYPALYAFQGLRFASPVAYLNNRNAADISFERCHLLGGMAYSDTGHADTETITFTRCHLDSVARLVAKSSITLDSCSVTGYVSSDITAEVLVRGCTFQGVGSNNAIVVTNATHCNISGNVIRDYSVGIESNSEDTMVSDNLIEDCTSTGILLGDLDGTATRNVVHRCGYGIYTDLAGKSVVSENTVTEATQAGLDVWAPDDQVTKNVIWRCGGNGMQVSYRGGIGWLTVTQNTSCFNGESGFASDTQAQFGQVWAGNIGYGNKGYGANWTRDDGVKMGCNDWFGNGLGDVHGQPLSGGDFRRDPRFCNADSGDFQLDSASPLLGDSTCGQIGALGVGCGETPTLVQRFSAERTSDGVRVVWEVALGATASRIWLERSDGSAVGPWVVPVTERSTEGRSIVELDNGPALDREYWYRLMAQEVEGVVVIGAPVVVEAQPRLEFRLAEVGPNPGGGPVRIEFVLKHAASIEICVFDVQGRRVASPAQGAWPAGTHSVEWDGRTLSGDRAPAGMYFLRYQYPGGQDRRALVRMR
jgi:parallel beta helix pectate lyase-like protein/flagellar hook capping protein FlgD